MIQIDDTMYARLFLFYRHSRLRSRFSVGGNVYYESLKLSSEEMFSRLVRIIFERGTIPRLFRISHHVVCLRNDTRIVYVRVVKFAKSSAHLPESNSTIRKMIERRANRLTRRVARKSCRNQSGDTISLITRTSR